MSRKENIFLTINVLPGKKNICGSSTVMSHYRYHMDTNLGEGKCALRSIPCYDLDGLSPQVKRAALSLVTSSVRCRFIFYQIADFGPLFQVDLRNNLLMDRICTIAVFL